MSFVGVFRMVEKDETPFLVCKLEQTKDDEDFLLIPSYFFNPQPDKPKSSYKPLAFDYSNEDFPLVPSYFHVPQTVFFGKLKFPRQSVECPFEIKHPSHPFHSLQFCEYYPYIHPDPQFPPTYPSISCHTCGEKINGKSYNCMNCELHMHPLCAKRPVPFVVDHPKSHPHPLIFFPTQASTVCHICSQINKLDPTYICIECVFVIHKSCIGFPHVIRISRHPHRLSFTSSLPSEELSCGVCHEEVDNNYGAYSCMKCGDYFVHYKCALLPEVWDGKELEGVPEEDDAIDDGEPFERIADGIILHPFHCHHLRLEIFKAYDENKYCQGCALPIYEGQFYSCMECDYILHESCANAPRQIRHPLNPHPLTLHDATKKPADDEQCCFCCNACKRDGNGFFYVYTPKTEWYPRSFELDLRCASILEPFTYPGSKDPLFLPLTEKRAPCQICNANNATQLYSLNCDYFICFRCATFPYKVRYKHDSHFLMISDENEASDQPVWCEICESKIEVNRENERGKRKERRFYKCNDCSTTLHVKCFLGKDFSCKPSKTIILKCSTYTPSSEIQTLRNSSLTRPFCTLCRGRCPFPIFFKDISFRSKTFCSLKCFILLNFRDQYEERRRKKYPEY